MQSAVAKLEKIYLRGDIFKSYIEKTDIFPIVIKLKRITQKDIVQNFSAIQKEIQKLKAQNLPLVYREFNFKSIGVQNLPVEVRFDNLEEYLNFIGKSGEYEKFVLIYDEIIAKYPKLKGLFYKKPFWVLEYSTVWSRIFKVIDFLAANKEPNCYIRELSIKGVDTKFVEKYKKLIDIILSEIHGVLPLGSLSNFAFEKRYKFYYPLPQIRFRILDKKLFIQGLSDLELSVKEFANLKMGCKKVFIIENKITFLSFFEIEDSIAIFGSGYKVSALKDAKWLQEKEIYYWGDIDLDGFAILSQLRSYFPNAKSFLMNEETIEKFKDLSVEYIPKNVYRELENLTLEEKRVYKRLQNDFYGKNFRLEQERLPFSYVRTAVSG